MVCILNPRQSDAHVTCAAYKKNVLAICDDFKTGFTTFELKVGDQIELNQIQDYRLNNRITSCDLSEDGFILAMGLDSGDVVVWNVPGKRQLRLLKHHKTPVHCCSFSPVPDRLYRSANCQSPATPLSPPDVTDEDNTPLVLVTMASEIVWWNVTYIMKMRANKSYWRFVFHRVCPPLSPPNVTDEDNTPLVLVTMASEIVWWNVTYIMKMRAKKKNEELYNNNCPSNCTIQPKLGLFLNCRWANHHEVLIAHTAKMIVLYNVDGTVLKVFDNFDRDQEILCCAPCNYDNYLIAAVVSNGANYLFVIDQTSKDKIMTIKETGPVLNILVVPSHHKTIKIITLKAKEITQHLYQINYQSNTCMCNKIIEAKDVKDNLLFLTIVVNKIGTLLFASTDDSRVICIDLKTNSRIFDLENRRGNVVSMDVSEIAVWNDFEPGSDVLLTGTGTIENSAKVWNLEPTYVLQQTQKNGKVRLTKRFDVSFNIAVSPQTPSTTATNSTVQSASTTPKRHQSFQHTGAPKRPVVPSLSLDRRCIKPLNLRGLCNSPGATMPLLAVVDDKSNIQVMRGRKVLTEIITQPEEEITTIKISPCNLYVIYGLRSGIVKKYALRSKETEDIMNMYSSVQYLNFVNPQLLIVGSKNSLMAYRLTNDGDWQTEMMQCEKVHLGSQEILNDIQGIKKKSSQADNLSSSGSESSQTSRSRGYFNHDGKSRLRGVCGLVDCFYIRDVGFITVESNALVKLWSQEANKMVCILNPRQSDAHVTCAAYKKNVLAICDDFKTGFTTFELKVGDQVELNQIQDYRLNNRITSCDLSEDGFILAMGLDSGDVVVWNVPGKRQLRLLKHHKTPVHCCSFSPVPDRLYRSANCQSPATPLSPPDVTDEDNTPLVLVTMASEIVWWNVTYIMKMRANKSYWRTGRNVMTPLASPMESKVDLHEAMENLSIGSSNSNFFFGNGSFQSQDCFKLLWKGKKYKEGSKKKEILACIKLTGMSAKKICHDEKFSCFVTVDNSGRVHVMNAIQDT
ncbi:uncharacterized protein LOC114358431 [Ostrinia furnacalis]|uniref:uncharacterized protein LOC114358431 n=1 Tax=Ostrinia furnacalis TaxID=93504 RepID=UPI00103E3842|nr:uncharacterized protein LOC114358431 [Ostrinia furnacalis]